jgi:hypothetical protein
MAKQSISELAKHVNLPEKHTKQIVEYLKHDILLSLYRKNPEKPAHMAEYNVELNNKIAEVYQTKYGKKFDPKVHAKNKRLPLFLMGPPGQGKTASYFAAAKEVCAELGLNFVEHVTDNYVPRKEDFIMVVQECAGENSAITFGGVPKAEEITLPDNTKVSVLKKALNYRFTVFDYCAGGVLLFDDAANAASVIQNVLLPVAQNSTFQGLHIPNACIGFTGNLGALDGTYVAEQSSALLTRVIPMFVTDTVDDFIKRGYAYYNDELGDIGFFNFLRRSPEEFSDLPQSGQKSGFACSRSFDNFIQGMRSIVERNGGRGKGEGNSLEEIHSLAYSCFGPKLGGKIAGYYNSYIRGADPLAHQFIIEGKFDADKLKKSYNHGASSEDISFGYQFATACGDYVVNLISSASEKDLNIESKHFEEAIQRFGKAVLELNDSEFNFSIEHMKNKLAAHVTNFSQPNKEGRELISEVQQKIAVLINNLPDCTAGKRDILVRVITNFDKIQGTSSLGVKKGARKPIGSY